MPSSPRYAIYLAPPPQDPLWRFGSTVLGYDAAAGEETPGFVFDGYGVDEWRRLTTTARSYGFHATLKAPFRLKRGVTTQDLAQALAMLAGTLAPFSIDPLVLKVLGRNGDGGFLALVPEREPPALAALERKVVTELDAFRARLTKEEIAKRQPESLTERQRDHLKRYGYPYIFEDFGLHFTLSDRIANAERAAGHLAQTIRNQIGVPSFRVDALVLFEQVSPFVRFRIMGRFPFGG
jgi:hypothetical protein